MTFTSSHLLTIIPETMILTQIHSIMHSFYHLLSESLHRRGYKQVKYCTVDKTDIRLRELCSITAYCLGPNYLGRVPPCAPQAPGSVRH